MGILVSGIVACYREGEGRGRSVMTVRSFVQVSMVGKPALWVEIIN